MPVNSVLENEIRRYSDSQKVSNVEDAKRKVVPVVEDVVRRIFEKDRRFAMTVEFRGSIYENLKIKSADEFDFDLPITQLAIDEIPSRYPSGSEEYTEYFLESKDRDSWGNLADENNRLSAERVVQTFANLVKVVVDDMNRENQPSFKFQCGTNHPAVTIQFQKNGKTVYDVDLAPVIEVRQWPESRTSGWETRRRHGWPSHALIKEIKERSVYLVSKLPKGEKYDGRNNYLWRLAFNKAEKTLFKDPDTQVQNSCKRPVLRILKGLRMDLGWQGLRSYHIKTVLLHEFESRKPSDWAFSEMTARVIDAVRSLRDYLSRSPPTCQHYFLTGINIFKGMNQNSLATLRREIDTFLGDPLEALNKIQHPSGYVPHRDFQIFLKDTDGRSFTLSVNSELKISQLINKVAEMKGISASQFRLVYNGRNLDSGTIGSNGIRKDAIVHLFGRLRGGFPI